MNLEANLTALKNEWTQPGVNLIICNPAATAAFWQQVRQWAGRSVLITAPNTLAACQEWYAKLSQSFLGAQEVYWVQTPSPWAPKAKKDVLTFLSSYKGPHALWFVCEKELAQQIAGARKTFTFAETVPYRQLLQLAPLLDNTRGLKALQHAGITKMSGAVNLDAAVSVCRHAQFVPLRDVETARNYLSRLLPHDGSLTALAQRFFAGDTKGFLLQWQKIESAYSQMFWVAFWSEQCWRAYWVCHYLRQGQSARARSLSYRLPAAFAQQLWRQQRPKDLVSLHQQLSFFDTRVKKGSLFTLSELLTNTMSVCRVQ